MIKRSSSFTIPFMLFSSKEESWTIFCESSISLHDATNVVGTSLTKTPILSVSYFITKVYRPVLFFSAKVNWAFTPNLSSKSTIVIILPLRFATPLIKSSVCGIIVILGVSTVSFV